MAQRRHGHVVLELQRVHSRRHERVQGVATPCLHRASAKLWGSSRWHRDPVRHTACAARRRRGAALADEHLAAALACDALAEGVADLREGADLVGDDVQVASRHHPHERVQVLNINLWNKCLEITTAAFAARAQCLEDLEIRCRDVAAAGPQHVCRPVHLLGASCPTHAIQDEVKVLPGQERSPILLSEVDGTACPEVQHPSNAAGWDRGGHYGALAARHLHRQVPGASVAA
mmetsp:Transcript_129052/g.334627  ORF Transcript_129052/g.334627 Transcript_129052/m.334627 type:complete len:232 (-) Transcript_129052:128-823(-)